MSQMMNSWRYKEKSGGSMGLVEISSSKSTGESGATAELSSGSTAASVSVKSLNDLGHEEREAYEENRNMRAQVTLTGLCFFQLQIF